MGGVWTDQDGSNGGAAAQYQNESTSDSDDKNTGLLATGGNGFSPGFFEAYQQFQKQQEVIFLFACVFFCNRRTTLN